MTNIPKIIWQTCSFELNSIPRYIQSPIDTWKEKNPNWEYKYSTDKDCQDFILSTYGNEYLQIYNNIPPGQIKADFWRYLVVYEHGGLYADVDTVCLEPIEEWVDLDKELVVTSNSYPELGGEVLEQWCFAAAPKSIILKSVIDKMISLIKLKNYKSIDVSETGPLMWTGAIKEQMPNDKIKINPFGVQHFAANNRWSDHHDIKMFNEMFYWDLGSNFDIKITNNGYSSAGIKA
jgi:mannosyltransferase OCH1-like enzyme